MFEWIPKVISQRKMGKMIDEAVSERVGQVIEHIPAFEEGGATPPLRVINGEVKFPVSIKGGTVKWSKREKANKLIEYLTDRKRLTTRRTLSGGYTMTRSPYRYDRIDGFYGTEAYFSRSVTRQVETMLRNGIDLVSNDPKIAAEVRKEFHRIQMDCGMSTEQMFWRWIRDLLSYGVVFIEKIRKRITDPLHPDEGRQRKISRFRIMNPNNLTVFVDSNGMILSAMEQSYSLTSVSQQRKNPPTPGVQMVDLSIIFAYDAGDEIFPIPPCYQMLNDILTLRSIEETIELLCFQFGSPLLHAKVGTEAEPASPDEVTQVNNNLVSMAPNGMVTTDHRVTIDTIPIQKAVANLMPFVEHFKNRVIIGSGTSPVSVGEGNTANRATSESIDDSLADKCTYLASVVCSVLNYNIIPDILIGNGHSPEELFDKNGDLVVQARFNEMRLEKQIARENAILNMWNANLITHPEARNMLKKRPLSKGDEGELLVNKVSIPLAQAKTEMGGPGGGSAGGGSAAYVRTQSQPRNQHGTKAGPGSRKN